MKPTITCSVARTLLKKLGSDIRTRFDGAPHGDLDFPPIVEDTDLFRKSYQAYNLCRKIELGDDSLDEKSIESWKECEASCRETNKNLTSRLRDASPFDKRVVIRAIQLISDCIGNEPCKDRWFSLCDFSGGASTSRRRKDANAALKWWARPSLHVTPLALPLLEEFKQSLGALGCVWDNPGALSTTDGVVNDTPWVTIAKGSHLRLVEKTYKVKRVILVEPDGNMLLQKGLGALIKEDLYNVGIDLFDQTHNQRLAHKGSVDGTVATVDGESASDLIALTACSLLFPPKWFDALYNTRSHITKIGDEWHTLQKLSSMGNGYTFEVESLIFWALSQALVDVARPKVKTVSVFGDDVICPSSVYNSLVRIYALFGFRINKTKSFASGPFRESCGKHYHKGFDVSPFHIRSELDCLSERFRLANQAYAWEGYIGLLTESILATIPLGDRRQIPLEFPVNQGLHFECVGIKPIRLRRHRSYGTVLEFSRFQDRITRLQDRFEDECRWFYSIMHGHRLSGDGYVLSEHLLIGDKGWSNCIISTSGRLVIP